MPRWVVTARVLALVAGAGLAGSLGGCGGNSGFRSASADPGTKLSNLLAFNSLTAPLVAPSPDLEEKPTCPDVEVLDGTASSRVYGAGEPTNTNVRYQFSLGEVVRECGHAGNQLTLKVGAEGRALLGPVGAAGAFTAPVRIAVRSGRDEKVVYSKLYAVPVSIGTGEAQGAFSIVSDPIAVPYVSARADEDYEILVGFDTNGKLDTKPKLRKARR